MKRYPVLQSEALPAGDDGGVGHIIESSGGGPWQEADGQNGFQIAQAGEVIQQRLILNLLWHVVITVVADDKFYRCSNAPSSPQRMTFPATVVSQVICDNLGRVMAAYCK
jgi:hypothetical protein